MAGLFGMFDSSKPGPGVSKNEPKKKRFFLFWELYFRKFGKFILANLLYVLVSLPIVTQGLAQAGLTFVTRNYAREKHVFLASDFKDTIKRNWKQALIVGLIELAVLTLLIVDLVFFAWPMLTKSPEMDLGALIFFGATVFMIAFFCYMRYYLYIQLITFKFSLKQIWKNSFLFAIAGMKENLVITGSLVLIYALAVLLWFAFDFASIPILRLGYVFFFPAFRSFLIQFTIFPIIKRTIIDPYYKEHPDEDLDKRHDLNLDDPSEQEETEETGEQAAQPADPSPSASVEEDDVIFRDTGREEPKEKVDIPKQYSREELLKGRRLQQRGASADNDDGTI